MEVRLRAAISAIAVTAMVGVVGAQKIAGIPESTQLNPGKTMPGNGNFIVIGCISRQGQESSQSFVITDTRANPPAQYRLDGDADLLRMHVGHTVEIGGPITPGAAGAKPGLKVLSLTYIATTCHEIVNSRP
jgi:hypothetical protein